MNIVEFFLWVVIIISFLSFVASAFDAGWGVYDLFVGNITMGIGKIVSGVIGTFFFVGSVLYWKQELNESAHKG